MTRFIYYTFTLCIIASCASINESLTKLEMLKCDEKMPPSIGYNVIVSPSTRSYGYVNFVLEAKLINDKILEMLPKSSVHSPGTTPTLYTIGDNSDTQGPGDSEKSVSDYHFSINIGWEKVSLMDEFINESIRPGVVAGSLGLFPVTISDKIEMNIYVTSSNTDSKSYHYEESVTYVFWAPVSFTKMAMNDGNIVIGSEKCIPKIENMMKKFIKDFYEDWCSELHSSD